MSYVVDYCGHPDRTVVAGIGEQQHNGRVYPHPAGDCDCCGARPGYSGALIPFSDGFVVMSVNREV